MIQRVRGSFHLRPGEIRLVLVMGFILFFNSLALQVANIVSISGFLTEVPVADILVVWIVEMILIIASTGVQSLIIDRFHRLDLLRWMSMVFVGLYVLLALMFAIGFPKWLNYTLLMLFVDQQLYFFPSVYWVLANDVMDMSQAKRIFPLIASFGIVGEIAGLGISALAPDVLSALHLASTSLLYLIIFAYCFPFALSFTLRKVHVRKTLPQAAGARRSLSEGWNFIKEVPSFRYLMYSMIAVAVVVTIFEYHFLFSTDAIYSEMENFERFYSLIFLAQTIIAIFLQSLVTRRLISRFGLKNTFLVMPMIALLCVGGALGLPGIVGAAGAYLIAKLALNSVDDIARNTMQALVPEERRGRVSMFMDSYLFATGVIISAVIIGAILLLQTFAPALPASVIYLAIGGILSVVALWLILRMRAVYDISLFNWRLKRRQRSASVIDKLGL